MHRAPIHSVSPPAHPLHPLAPGREIRPNSLKNSRKNAQNRPAPAVLAPICIEKSTTYNPDRVPKAPPPHPPPNFT